MERCDAAIDENAIGIEDEDDEVEVGVDFSVGSAQEGDVRWIDGVGDDKAAKWTVNLFTEDVSVGRFFLGLGWRR